MSETSTEQVVEQVPSLPMPTEVQSFLSKNFLTISKFVDQIYETANPTTKKGRRKTSDMSYWTANFLNKLGSFLKVTYPANTATVSPEIVEQMNGITESIESQIKTFPKYKAPFDRDHFVTRRSLGSIESAIRGIGYSSTLAESREVILEKIERAARMIREFNSEEGNLFTWEKDEERMYNNLRQNKDPWG